MEVEISRLIQYFKTSDKSFKRNAPLIEDLTSKKSSSLNCDSFEEGSRKVRKILKYISSYHPEPKLFPKTDLSFCRTSVLWSLLLSRKKMTNFHNFDLDYETEKSCLLLIKGDQKKGSLIYLLIFCTFLSVFFGPS